MNRNSLKKYAPEARRDFIRAVTDRASYYGLTAKKTEPVTIQGDIAVISGRAFPKKLADQRKRLEDRIKRQGFDQVMEAMAYTWFNRLVAIRYMELHGYLDHGYRVLSHPEGGATPEIVEHAEHVDLPGLDKQKVVSLKLEGTKEAELYRMLLIAQCNALHSAMPFLFERIDDETELLLPDNLLHSDSLIRTLVSEIPEEDWQEVEIIGWLYQFYISEKKDQVIGKVVKSEDIPAATQLFTPNWIVKYLVQNSLGRQWVATYPNSSLKGEMEYYIEPAEQTPEVQEQLKAITPDSLDPEELTLLDPACGSGHILVEAYDLLKAIYQERGYPKKDIPRLILTKNLYGLEIDDRAAQLAAFALMMKARADDRRIFAQGIQPHVLSIQESKGLDAKEITEALNAPLGGNGATGEISQADVAHLIDLFEHGKTFGSLIQVPEKLALHLPKLSQRIAILDCKGDLFGKKAANSLKHLLRQCELLAGKYSNVVANPPYMDKGINKQLKAFAKSEYPISKINLFSMFMERGITFASRSGRTSMITMHSWMFLSKLRKLRERVLDALTIESMAHLGPRAFSTISGEVVQTTAFSFLGTHIEHYVPTFFRLTDGEDVEKEQRLRRREGEYARVRQSDFSLIPGSPIAYWTSERLQRAFSQGKTLESISKPRAGISTGNNSECIYYWWEVDATRIGFGQGRSSNTYRFYPHNKGGGFRRWFGNCFFVLKYAPADISRMSTYPGFRHDNSDFYFRPSVSWGKVTSLDFCARYYPQGFAFDGAGLSLFFDAPHPYLAFLNSKVFSHLLNSISNTLNFTVGDVGRTPVLPGVASALTRSEEAVNLSRRDWDSAEWSWDYSTSPLLSEECHSRRIEESFHLWEGLCGYRLDTLRQLESENNALFIEIYGLQGEVSAEVVDNQITLYRPRRGEDIQRLISYAIGCMMGRYSLDESGLIYAHNGGEGFDPGRYQTFSADSDGIIPVTEFEWFKDDAAKRLEEFIAAAWPKEHLEENVKFVAESLGPSRGERPRETIRRYLSTGFYKHHLSLYKKRPIYWLFSSGRERAFQCLVYLHRYNAGTLSRMRTEYVIPLSGKMASRIDQLEGDIAAASSTSHRKKLEKERQTLVKQREELQAFDELLRHYADQRIKLDLDDGVKVNYGKFGNLLAELKAVTGGTSDE